MTLDELIAALQELRDGELAGRFEVAFEPLAEPTLLVAEAWRDDMHGRVYLVMEDAEEEW